MKWPSCLALTILCVCIGSSISTSQSYTYSKLDGNYWKGLERSAFDWLHGFQTESGQKPQFKDGTSENLAHNLKSTFMVGILEMGFSVSLTGNLYLGYTDKEKTRYVPYSSNIEGVLKDVSPEQFVLGLDKFYQDYRNTNVRILDAMGIISKEIKGESQTSIDWWTRYYRATPENRTKMMDELPQK